MFIPILNVRCSDGIVRKSYNGTVISHNALVIFSKPNLALITKRNISLLPTGVMQLPWGVHEKRMVNDETCTVAEFRDYLNTIKKTQKKKPLIEYIDDQLSLEVKFPKLAGLRDVQKKNKKIANDELKNIARLDNYFYIAIGVYDILTKSDSNSEQLQNELEKFTFQAHLKQLKTDKSLNYTNDTSKFLSEKEEYIASRLQVVKTDVLNYNDTSDLDIDILDCLPLLELVFKFLDLETLSNSLINWSINLYKEEMIDEGNDRLKSTRLHFELGRLVYNKALNAGKYLFGEDRKFTAYLDSLPPIHDKIYDKSIDAKINYDQLTSVLGSILIDILRRAKVLNQFKGRENNKDYYYINTTDQMKDKLGVVNMTAARLPTSFPMIHPPKVWEVNGYGTILNYDGYLWNDKFGRSSLWYEKEHYSNTSQLTLDVNNENLLVNLINGLSRTAYRINSEVLDFIIDYNDELKFFKPYNSSIKTTNNKILAKDKDKSRNDFTTLVLALVYRNTDKFFLPVKADFRSRIYSDVFGLNYQGGDISRSIIEFYKPGVIFKTDSYAIMSFKAVGASLYSKDLGKASILDRVDWVNEHKDILSNIRNNMAFIKSSNPKKMCSFIAWCFEFSKFVEWENSDSAQPFYTRLPLQLDASCSGLQHLVMLIKDLDNMPLLNLSGKNINEEPSDFYGYTANTIKLIMQNYLMKTKPEYTAEEKSKRESYERLIAFDLDRTHIKSSIMTYSYNASKITMAEYIEEQLAKISEVTPYKEPKGLPIEKVSKDYRYKKEERPINSYKLNGNIICTKDVVLYVKLFESFFATTTPGIVALKEYLNKVAFVFGKLNIPVPWSLPSGVFIQSGYRETTTREYKPFRGERRSHTWRTVTNKLNVRKMQNSLMPNIIHSLDGCAIALLYKFKVDQF